MLERIISGGQTGADQAGWRAAQAFGVPTGGWMPSGFVTDDGPHPEFAEAYGATEMVIVSAAARIERNVEHSDATLWFGVTTAFAARVTVEACLEFYKPCMPIDPDASFEPSHVANWILESKIRTLNVTGNGEAEEPGISERVEVFLGLVLQQLGHQRS
jgi:Circularly permutated YpsA SLOG family